MEAKIANSYFEDKSKNKIAKYDIGKAIKDDIEYQAAKKRDYEEQMAHEESHYIGDEKKSFVAKGDIDFKKT